MDKRKTAILKELIQNMDNDLGVEGCIENIIDNALENNDCIIDDAGDKVFDVYELKDFTRSVITQCQNFIESFIKVKPND